MYKVELLRNPQFYSTQGGDKTEHIVGSALVGIAKNRQKPGVIKKKKKMMSTRKKTIESSSCRYAALSCEAAKR